MKKKCCPTTGTGKLALMCVLLWLPMTLWSMDVYIAPISLILDAGLETERQESAEEMLDDLLDT